jgi:ribonuclease HII
MNDEKRRNKTASLKLEQECLAAGHRYVYGVDEAGRGPWAGPVAAGIVALPLDRADLPELLKGVKDSKQMTHRQREAAAGMIKSIALAWGVGSASADEISVLGLTAGVKLAMQRALDLAVISSGFQPDYLLMDKMHWTEIESIPHQNLVKGDQLSLSIAAASVLAKTWRDEFMLELHAEFPYYGFDHNKGYGTEAHRAALATYGVSPVHRRNYAPVQAFLPKLDG